MTEIHPAIAGHAMEENERLRQALQAMLDECDPLGLNCGEPWCRARAALSQHAEPVESAGAQDERAMQLLSELSRPPQDGEKVTRERMAAICEVGHDRAAFVAALTRPAQTEQQLVPVPGLAEAPSRVEAVIVAIRDLWDEDECPAYPVVATALRGMLYAAPIAQTAPRCKCCGYLVTDSEHRGCLRAAAPQPERSGRNEYMPLELIGILQRYKRDLELRTFPDTDEGDYQLRWTAKEIARVSAALSAQGGEE